MLTTIFRVVSVGDLEPYTTKTGTPSHKRQVRLQEFGGFVGSDNPAQRISNGFAGTLFGNLAQWSFLPNELVVATLRFSTREFQGQWYQDVTITDIQRLTSVIQ